VREAARQEPRDGRPAPEREVVGARETGRRGHLRVLRTVEE
jgi:hypothetical protein